MSFLRERLRVSPETGVPDPDLDVSDASGEASSIRRAVKQIKDAGWNLQKAREETNDEERKAAYTAFSADLDKMHAALAPTYDALRRGGASVRVRKEQGGSPGQYGMAGGIRQYLDPKADKKKDDDFGAQPRGRTSVGTDKQAGIIYGEGHGDIRGKYQMKGAPADSWFVVQGIKGADYILKTSFGREERMPQREVEHAIRNGIMVKLGEARESGRGLLREAQIALGAVKQEPWYPGFTTWTPRLDFATQGDYALGDASRGVVRSIADDARSPVHPREVAEMIAQAVSALYAEGRATDYPWFGHTTGMPDELGEGLIVTQEEVYWSVRKLSGDNAATPEYLDEVYKELYAQGLRVATKRPNTLERRQHTA